MKLANRLPALAGAIAVFAVNWGLDRLTKELAVTYLKGQPAQSFFGDLMVWVYAVNTGAFLSLGANWPEPLKLALLLVVPLALCLGALVWVVVRETSVVRGALIVTVAAGGFGNLVDRLFNDFQVIDFLNFGIGPLRTGVLNVADLSVTFGALALVVWELRQRPPREPRP